MLPSDDAALFHPAGRRAAAAAGTPALTALTA